MRDCHRRSASGVAGRERGDQPIAGRAVAAQDPHDRPTSPRWPPRVAGTCRSNELPALLAGVGGQRRVVERARTAAVYTAPVAAASLDLTWSSSHAASCSRASRQAASAFCRADPCGVGLDAHPLEPGQRGAELRGAGLGEALGVAHAHVELVDLGQPLAGGRLGVLGAARAVAVAARNSRWSCVLGGREPARVGVGLRPLDALAQRVVRALGLAQRVGREAWPGRPRSTRPRSARPRAPGSCRTGRRPAGRPPPRPRAHPARPRRRPARRRTAIPRRRWRTRSRRARSRSAPGRRAPLA